MSIQKVSEKSSLQAPLSFTMEIEGISQGAADQGSSIPSTLQGKDFLSSYEIGKSFTLTVFSYFTFPFRLLWSYLIWILDGCPSEELKDVFSPLEFWRKESVPWERAYQKMQANTFKAVTEHMQTFYISHPSETENPFVQTIRYLCKESPPIGKPLRQISPPFFAEAQGPREKMEEAHFYQQVPGGVVIGVLDGHGGTEVSSFASFEFQKLFPQAVALAKGNIHEALETVIFEIHQKVCENSGWNAIGSTLVVSCIDQESGMVYTATVGDSQAMLFREDHSGQRIPIPLSPVRDWLSEKDNFRLIAFHGKKEVNKFVQLAGNNPKFVRSHLEQGGTNVSRGIGGKIFSGLPGYPLEIPKPKITCYPILPGDILLLGCDGVFDYISERELTWLVNDSIRPPNAIQKFLGRTEKLSLAETIVQRALKKMSSLGYGDNVTVGVLKIQ